MPTSTGMGDGDTAVGDEEYLRIERTLDRLLSSSTSMTGICVGLLGAVNAFARAKQTDTPVDDILAVNALLFLSCCYLIVWALRTTNRRRSARLLRVTEFVFLGAMSLLVLVGFFVVYAIL